MQPSMSCSSQSKMDGLLDLLNATADALAATWDLQMDAVSEIAAKPTIH